MLDTVIQIGRTFRTAQKLEHHRFIKRAPLSGKQETVRYLSVPVRSDMSLNVSRQQEITDENVITKQLFYLTFKTSGSDGMVKYMFGDICFGYNKDGKEVGFYTMGDKKNKQKAFHTSSFFRGEKDSEKFRGSRIEKFRDSFRENIDKIESLLANQEKRHLTFLHFDFSEGRHWYELKNEMDLINRKLLDELVAETPNGLVLRKSLYKTIASAEKDTQFPGFSSVALHKVRRFQNPDELMDLIYAIDFSKRAIISEKDVKIIVLPSGKQLAADEIEDFFRKKASPDEVEQIEAQISNRPVGSSSTEILDSLFDPVISNVSERITHFDFVFSKRGGVSSPDVDLIEVPAIARSLLSEIATRTRKIQIPLDTERDERYPNRPKQFQGRLEIRRSLFNILADATKAKKKFQSHLFKTLPQLYTGTYNRDPLLLPAFIEKVEYNVRNDNPNFNLLKYDYFFLTNIQTSNGGPNMDEMKNSKSYRAGLFLGQLAQPLDRKIASFEKNYVGLLSRRISDKAGLMKFKTFMDEKLAIHDVAYPNLKAASVELAKLVSEIADSEYNKNHCAFGFFESYFAYRQKAEPEQADIPTENANN